MIAVIVVVTIFVFVLALLLLIISAFLDLPPCRMHLRRLASASPPFWHDTITGQPTLTPLSTRLLR